MVYLFNTYVIFNNKFLNILTFSHFRLIDTAYTHIENGINGTIIKAPRAIRGDRGISLITIYCSAACSLEVVVIYYILSVFS